MASLTTAAGEKWQAYNSKGYNHPKYSEIYSNVVWRQMKDNDDNAKEIVNMFEECLHKS
jgi:hypothetical protein